MELNLSLIAAKLEGLEETIIAKLIDRAQFHANHRVYEPGHSGFENEPDACLFELRLRFQEEMDAQFGRFQVPEERPFNRNLPEPKRSVSLPPSGLNVDDLDVVNLSSEIKRGYLGLMPRLCRDGDDGQYGSSVEHDVYALQAIARRIHFGSLYVAESKFSAEPDVYGSLAAAGDREGLEAKLTRPEVEDKIIDRIEDKVVAIQAQANPKVRHLIDPTVIVNFYRSTVIPLTKKGEVAYLLARSS